MKRKSSRKTPSKYRSPLKRRKKKPKRWSVEEKELLRVCTNQIKQLGHIKYYWKRVTELFLQNTPSPRNHRSLISITTMGNRMKLGSGSKSKKWTNEEKDHLWICSIKVKKNGYSGNFWKNLSNVFGDSRSLHSIISIGGPMDLSPSNTKKPWTIQEKKRLAKCAKEIRKSNYTGDYWSHVSDLFGVSRSAEGVKKKGIEMKLNLVGLGKRWTEIEKNNLLDCMKKVRLRGYRGNYWKKVSELYQVIRTGAAYSSDKPMVARTVVAIKYMGNQMKRDSKQVPIRIIEKLDKSYFFERNRRKNQIILNNHSKKIASSASYPPIEFFSVDLI